MSSWWIALGYPPFDDGKGGFPRTGQVVKYYREQKRDDTGKPWTQRKLALHLNVTEQTVRDIENRDASIDVERRQFLSNLFAIPSILLGIVTREEILKMVEQERAKGDTPIASTSVPPLTLWWVELEYPSFGLGKDHFFPRTGQVVKHYREQKKDDTGKPWTQRGLALALDVTEQTVRDIENRDANMDFDRRQFLSKFLDIPSILLGIRTSEEILRIMEQESKKTPVVSTLVSTSRKLLIDTKDYHGYLVSSRNAHISRTAYSSMTDILLRINSLYGELPHVREKEQIQDLLCEYHQFVADMLRDQQKYDDAIINLNKAFRFAKLLKKDEVKALVLHRRGRVLHEAGRIDLAIRDYEEARQYERGLPGSLSGPILLYAGLVGAKAAKNEEEKKKAIHLLDRGGNIIRTNRNEGNLYWVDFGLDRYHLNKGAALIAAGQNNDAINELKLVKIGGHRWHGSEYPRGQAETDILKAQANTNLGKYSEAVGLAESGLLVVQRINSAVNIARVEKIYRELKESPYKDNPDVARLDYLLRKR